MVSGAGRHLMWCIENPREVVGDERARLAAYRRARDTLRALIAEELPRG